MSNDMTQAKPYLRSRLPLAIAFIVGVLAVIALSNVLSDYLLTALIMVLFSCYLAQCWNLVAGYAGQLALGQPLFLAIGGYVSSVLFAQFGITPWLGMWAGAALAAVCGALLAVVAFRYQVKGIFFALITVASSEVAHGLALHWGLIGGASGIHLILSGDFLSMTFYSRVPYFWIMASMVAMITWVTYYVSHSKFGQYLMALREDEEAAEAAGVPTYRCKIQVVALSAFFTAIAGTFFAQFLLFIAPDMVFKFQHMLGMILGVMVGGAGTITGPIIGSVLFAVLSEVFRALPFTNSHAVASTLQIIYALILILVVLKLPGGLVSLVKKWGLGRQ